MPVSGLKCVPLVIYLCMYWRVSCKGVAHWLPTHLFSCSPRLLSCCPCAGVRARPFAKRSAESWPSWVSVSHPSSSIFPQSTPWPGWALSRAQGPFHHLTTSPRFTAWQLREDTLLCFFISSFPPFSLSEDHSRPFFLLCSSWRKQDFDRV